MVSCNFMASPRLARWKARNKDIKDCKDAKDNKDAQEVLRSVLLVLWVPLVLWVLYVLENFSSAAQAFRTGEPGFARRFFRFAVWLNDFVERVSFYAEQVNFYAERTNFSAERVNDSAERVNDSAERTNFSAERTNFFVEWTNFPAELSDHSALSVNHSAESSNHSAERAFRRGKSEEIYGLQRTKKTPGTARKGSAGFGSPVSLLSRASWTDLTSLPSYSSARTSTSSSERRSTVAT